MQDHNYFCPGTILEALNFLKETEGKARVIAGGTDLMINLGNAPDKTPDLLDVSRIGEFQGIHDENGYIVMGGGVTHSEVAQSVLIQGQAKVLAQACSHVGSKQIRNIATLAGNIITALPAADSAVALSALEAECEIYHVNGSVSWKPLSAMYAGVGKSTLLHGSELLTKIRFKKDPNRKSAYERMVIRKALSLPMLCTGVALSIRNNVIEQVKVIIAPAGPSPLCAESVEKYLLGKTPSIAVFDEAVKLCLDNTEIRSSAVRGSKEYREKVLPVYVKRALVQAAL